MESPPAVGQSKSDASQPYQISEAHNITMLAQIRRSSPISLKDDFK